MSTVSKITPTVPLRQQNQTPEAFQLPPQIALALLPVVDLFVRYNSGNLTTEEKIAIKELKAIGNALTDAILNGNIRGLLRPRLQNNNK